MYVKPYTMAWGLPADTDLVNIRIRCSLAAPSPDSNDPATYAIPYDEVGLVTQCLLPLPKTPMVDATLYVGVSGVDDRGNEGDISWVNFPFDLVAPAVVTDLRLI